MPQPSSRWKWPSAASSATSRTRRGGVCTSSENATAWTGTAIRGNSGGVVVQAGLPLRGEHRAVAVGEVGRDERLDPLPRLVVPERVGRVVLHRVVGGRERRREGAAGAPERDLRLLPLAHEPGLAHAGPHHDRARRRARGDRGRSARRSATPSTARRGTPAARRRPRSAPPGRRRARRSPRAAPTSSASRRRRGHRRWCCGSRLERRRLVAAPVLARVVTGGQPDDVGADAALAVGQAHPPAAARERQPSPSTVQAWRSDPQQPVRCERPRSRPGSRSEPDRGRASSLTLLATSAGSRGSSGSPAASSGPAAKHSPIDQFDLAPRSAGGAETVP